MGNENANVQSTDEIIMEQAIISEPCYTLADMLAGKNMPALRELAKLYKVNGYSGMNKQPLIQALVSQMTDDETMASYLMLLEEPEWNFFKEAAAAKHLTPDKLVIDSYLMPVKANLIGLYFHGDIFYCIVPDELKETYKRLEATGFIAEKEHESLLHQYALATTHLYGAISQDDFVKLFNRQNKRHINIDEAFSVLLKYVSIGYGYVFWDEYIVHDYFEKSNYKDVTSLIKSANRFSKYIPEKEELLKYADWSYFEETASTRKLRKYINVYIIENADLVDAIMKEIAFTCMIDAKFQAFFDIFEEHQIIFKDDQQVKRFLPYLTEMYNNSRKWSNNSQTPVKIKEEYDVKPLPKIKGNEEHYTVSIQKSPSANLPKVGRNEPCPCGSGKKYKK